LKNNRKKEYGMASRPYLPKSIKELEALFATQNTNATILVDLQAELAFRVSLDLALGILSNP
jgi:hypothetical protein